MLSNRQLFLDHVAQTSHEPMALEIVKAEGIYLYGIDSKRYFDLISGISVSNVGHCHPHVVSAIKTQSEKFMHLMVYGEYISYPQVALSKKLSDLLPSSLNSVYLVNSGSEATEGAMKLAKKYTNRSKIVSCNKAYHGSTHGALSILGDEYFKRNYRPLLPNTELIDYNSFDDLEMIDEQTAAVFMEVVQAEAAVILPQEGYLEAVRERCDKVGALLVFDEIQTGFGRLGTLFGFMQTEVIPDILLSAKGMGGGLPIGAFISSKKLMSTFRDNPILGHITTFGGNPVTCSASLAVLEVMEAENLTEQVHRKSELFRSLLQHEKIKEIRSKGLMMALQFESEEMNFSFIKKCISKGLIIDWFLFNTSSSRIAPPLIITESEIREACVLINEVLDDL